MFKKVIDKITSSSIKYRNGFLEFTYTSNSPEQIVKSSSVFSFVKHKKKENYISTNTFFFNILLNYFKVADGLWLLYTESKFKRNVKLISKPEKGNAHSDNYYMLILNVNSDCTDLKLFGQSEKYTATRYFWGFFKPNNTIETYNYKNSEAKYITICFNKEWLEKNFGHLLNKKDDQFGDFVKSDKKFIVCSELNEHLKLYFENIYNEFLNFRKNETMNLIQVQGFIFKLINFFLERIESDSLLRKKINITDEKRNLILKIERYLQSNLNKKFDGIDLITRKFNISETALKNNYKQIFGTSVYQYFSKHQMLLAKQILSEGNVSIKEIAYKFGYESPGKFSEAFKKQLGYLPSEVQS